MRLIHECMGLPASPPVTSEESEVDNDSPPSSRVATIPIVQSQPTTIVVPQEQEPQQQQQTIISIPIKQEPLPFNPQLITIDERTLQLHFTPLYFGRFDSCTLFS